MTPETTVPLNLTLAEAELLQKAFVHGVYGANTKVLQSLTMKIERAYAAAFDMAAKFGTGTVCTCTGICQKHAWT